MLKQVLVLFMAVGVLFIKHQMGKGLESDLFVYFFEYTNGKKVYEWLKMEMLYKSIKSYFLNTFALFPIGRARTTLALKLLTIY